MSDPIDWLHIATAVVTLASLVAALTPTPVDDGVLRVLRRVVDAVALNWRHATNAVPAPEPPPSTTVAKARSRKRKDPAPKE